MKNKHRGSTLDSLFDELGELEEVNALAAKKVLALQTERRMKELGLTTTALAERMGTSRNQVHRVLDQDDAGITLKVLFRLSKALRMPLRLAFDDSSKQHGGRRGLTEQGKYVRELQNEVGVPSRAEKARAEALVRKISQRRATRRVS